MAIHEADVLMKYHEVAIVAADVEDVAVEVVVMDEVVGIIITITITNASHTMFVMSPIHRDRLLKYIPLTTLILTHGIVYLRLSAIDLVMKGQNTNVVVRVTTTITMIEEETTLCHELAKLPRTLIMTGNRIMTLKQVDPSWGDEMSKQVYVAVIQPTGIDYLSPRCVLAHAVSAMYLRYTHNHNPALLP